MIINFVFNQIVLIYLQQKDMIEDLEGEIWKDIVGYDGLYQISNLGRVKNLSKIWWMDKNNTHRRYKPDTIIFNRIDNLGYSICTLYKNSIGTKRIRIHRLVAEAFIPNPDNKPCVNHINGIKNDNRIENLEWCTYSENIQHAYDNGLKISKNGKDHHHWNKQPTNLKLSEEQVIEIRNSCLKQYELAEIYNVHQCTISRIKNKKRWHFKGLK